MQYEINGGPLYLTDHVLIRHWGRADSESHIVGNKQQKCLLLCGDSPSEMLLSYDSFKAIT